MSPIPTHALSVRAPWWWAILYAGKDVENRDWRRSNPGRRFRGRVWLHASATRHVGDEHTAWETIRVLVGTAKWMEIVGRASLIATAGHRGAIVGSVEIAGFVDGPHPSPWFFGPGALVLRNPIALTKPIPCKGALGFFPMCSTAELMEQKA